MLYSLFSLLLFVGLFDFQDKADTPRFIPNHSILKEKQTITVGDGFDYTIRKEITLKVVDRDGLDHAFTSLFYDKLVEVKDFQLEATDLSTGKVIEKAKLKDMKDAAIYSTSSVFDDNRHKYYELETVRFPLEVKIQTESYHSTNFYFPTWIPVHHTFQKVEESILEVIYPESVGIRFKELNLLGTQTEEKLPDGRVKLTWIEKDLPIQGVDFETDDDHKVLLAPQKFAVDGVAGTMNDWEGLAAWQFELNKGRGELPEEFKSKILALVEGVDDIYERVSILYDFLQQNYRYVSIQLGVGGWQTMKAEDVVKYSYGDCKGLTNLMKSMLEVAGIPANYTLVLAGANKDDIEVDLPSNQFNHVILQVPTDNNPIWLECTSNLLPAGFLGDFTKNRHVLVTQEGGGYLTKTPSYNSDFWNKISGTSTLEIDAQGNANIFSSRQLEGNFAEEMMMLKHYLDEREQRDYFNKNSPVSGLIIRDYLLDVKKQDSIPTAKLEFEGHVARFAQATAKRLILKPFLGKITEDMLSNSSLNLEESYEIKLPEGLETESVLEDTKIDEDGLQVSLTNQVENGKLLVRRTINLNIPEEMEEESKEELLKRLNQLGQRSYYFTKSSPNTN